MVLQVAPCLKFHGNLLPSHTLLFIGGENCTSFVLIGPSPLRTKFPDNFKVLISPLLAASSAFSVNLSMYALLSFLVLRFPMAESLFILMK